MSLPRKIMVVLATILLTGCAGMVPNEEKTRWDYPTSDELWIQWMEAEIDFRSKRLEDL